jgi:hypothetical protein
LRKFSLDLLDDNLVKSQLCPLSQMQMIFPSIPMINNYQSGNPIILEEKEPPISISQTSSLFQPSKVSFEHKNFIFDKLFQNN